MAFADNLATFTQRMTANLPSASVGGQSVLLNLAQAFLSADADTQYLIQQATPNLFVTQATGANLDAVVANYGVSRNLGVVATGSVVFSIQAAATATITIPSGTVLSTVGDGVTTIPQLFVTGATATINISATSSNSVAVTATVPGSAGNVLASAISLIVTPVSSATYTVANASSTTGGTDPDTDQTLRNKALVAIVGKYTAAQVQAAILAVPGVFDAYVFDPQSGSGFIYYYWCDSTGAATGTTGGSIVGSGAPDSTNYLSGATLAGLAATVDAAVRAVLPPNITPRIGNAGGSPDQVFNAVNLTAVAVTWSGPANLQAGTIDPLIQAAVAAYVLALKHNQAVTVFGMSQAVQTALGGVLSNFTLTSTTPSSSGSAQTTIYRLNGSPTSVVTVTP